MKKSEKLKGKAAVAERKKQYTQYAVAAAAVIVVLLIIGFFLFNPFVAKNGDTVMVYYNGTLENGTIFYSNLDQGTFNFTVGSNTAIPGFEEAVIGMTVNSTKTVNIPFDKAYGPRLDSLIHVVNRSELSKDIEPVIGNMYTITRKADGAVARVQIINVTNDTITLDENHMLAGKNLTYTIRFVGFYNK